jgi:hypothetical protein
MKPDGSLPRPQDPSTGPYPEPKQSSPREEGNIIKMNEKSGSIASTLGPKTYLTTT